MVNGRLEMIKKHNHNLISIVVVTGMTGAEFLDHIALALDKAQELVYNVKSEVK